MYFGVDRICAAMNLDQRYPERRSALIRRWRENWIESGDFS
jgi:hypothetical protein